MKTLLLRFNDRLYMTCIWVAGLSVLGVALIIPWGIFTRYALGTGSSWPEPTAILLMLVFTFIGAAASYRAGAHMSVAMITDRLPPAQRRFVGILSQLLMGTICVFMTIWGAKLCLSTWNQFMSAIPTLRVGITYMPIPIGGVLTLVFVVEKLLLGDQSNRKVVRFDLVEENEGLPDMDALILLGSFVALILIGMPVAYALGLSALIGAWWIDIPFQALMIQIAGGVNKFSLMAIPFFVLAGAIMAEGGMSRRLVAFAGVLVGFVRGGLSLVNIMASTFFGAISGSSVADTASVGSVLIPEMERRGYPREFATAVTVSGSVQALLTPPSHNSVLYSLAAGGTVSIASLFMAGVVPGLMMSACLMVLCLIFAKKRNYPKGEVIPLKQALKIAADALWGLMAMVIILGGILSGIFTATESAAIAVLWAFFVTMFIYRDYKWRELPKLMHRTVRTISIVMILIAFAASFGYIMTLMQIPAKITTLFLTLSDNRYVILMCINVMLLLLGTVMDMAPLILILTPILMPVILGIGVDPVHFGMIMLVNLGIGLITPPVGAVLFVGAAVGKTSIEKTVKALLPFYAVLFLVLIAVTYIPALSLWLPHLVL